MSVKQPDETLHQHAARELSFILRNRALWPNGFEWDYTRCETCAMGLAVRLGMATRHNTLAMTVPFNMSVEEAEKIFIEARHHFSVARMSDITPEHIADLLDAYADRAILARIEGEG